MSIWYSIRVRNSHESCKYTIEQQSVAHAESKTERVALFPSHIEGRACASVAVMRIPTGVASGVALPLQGRNFGTECLASAPCGHLIVTFAFEFVVVALPPGKET